MKKGKIFVVGFGPGDREHITKRAVDALQQSDCIIGYKTYVDLIETHVTASSIVSTGMTEEVSRAQDAVKRAEAGQIVSVISSGDSGVYGMAGLVYEVLIELGWKEEEGIEVEIVPGISAINSCASLLGAPVMHDSCTISLSDHLTPWTVIEKRIEAAGMADFVIALYNPKSGRRTRQIVEAQRILLKYRSPDTPVGLVKSAYRENQNVILTTLAEMLDHDIGMLTTVVIGNSSTFFYDNKIITPRGYQRKYTLGEEKQSLKPHQRLKKEAEPWALNQETGEAVPGYEQIESKKQESSSLNMALKALSMVTKSEIDQTHLVQQPIEDIFEFAVSPGVANKFITVDQMRILAEAVGEKGTMEYTPDHRFLIKIPTVRPHSIVEKLEQHDLTVMPVGDVLNVKACDFCYGEKAESIPYAEEIAAELGGLRLPKELHIGFNGCGMACYRAVFDDIGIVYRKKKFDLFIGAKPVGRTAHAAQPVAEGIEPDQLVPLLKEIIEEYKENAHPNERLFKYFKRVKKIQYFTYQDMSSRIEVEPAPCGD
ncbi:precorrin-3B C(17)-methyltransferase [Cytobacillus firmus]|uniref:precorrin-3B C(17)-methyltransferase n=1 Tax=Cytobacillus firmus TaxID=1399 RepID=UPI001580BB0E|nr:precorrin-3B C(17)-methyltransferase [Cytobacillus firmus]MBG9549111.1 cobalt-precorrin-3B C(17)-methyltransferase [Cytobacillus firmus]MBG9603076.1 cobalt-precorrin-3B C(17)-methyltransferase [Cytobacillus firmus]MBG9654946.1 cobalt-precorrin-3B C(17)-methyltransferase [Cytobacillus firmus]MED1907682.1 precorrin-3B C(17)-methyltransferase [Cytobacillus firmus]MED1939733.1 precorrin-3B C(17)-methyltransferase [Cytobacillus firmus]